MAGRRPPGARQPAPRSQHFLGTAALAGELVRDAGIAAGDLVVDLGAGSGRLTNELARVARRVLAVELDSRLAARLRGRWDNVDVVEGDAARVRLPREPFRVVSNVPFSRTNDLLHLLLDDPRTPLLRADLIVQWGVAVKRGLPWPSTAKSVFWGAYYEATVTRRLPATLFKPPPAVDAGVLVFRRRTRPLVAPTHADSYRRFVSRGFRQGLASVVPRHTRHLIAAKGMLARDLDSHQWAQLFVAADDPKW